MLRPQKKKEDEFDQLVADLKENDHVVTIGGIHGVVTNVQRDADRVTIRVDESTGTKLRINTSAIARVVTDDDDSSGTRRRKIKINQARIASRGRRRPAAVRRKLLRNNHEHNWKLSFGARRSGYPRRRAGC